MIWCCKDCKAPKRHPGCHGSCPEYIEEKTAHENEREANFRKREVQRGLLNQREEGVKKANSRKRR